MARSGPSINLEILSYRPFENLTTRQLGLFIRFINRVEELQGAGLTVGGEEDEQRRTIRDYLNANYLSGPALKALFSNAGLKFENRFSRLNKEGKNHALRAYINAGAPGPALPNVDMDVDEPSGSEAVPAPPAAPAVPMQNGGEGAGDEDDDASSDDEAEEERVDPIPASANDPAPHRPVNEFRIPRYTPFKRLTDEQIHELILIIRPRDGWRDIIRRAECASDRVFIQRWLSDAVLDNATAMRVIRAFRIPRGGRTAAARNNRILHYVGLPPRHGSGAGFFAGVATGLALAGVAAAVVGQFAG